MVIVWLVELRWQHRPPLLSSVVYPLSCIEHEITTGLACDYDQISALVNSVWGAMPKILLHERSMGPPLFADAKAQACSNELIGLKCTVLLLINILKEWAPLHKGSKCHQSGQRGSSDDAEERCVLAEPRLFAKKANQVTQIVDSCSAWQCLCFSSACLYTCPSELQDCMPSYSPWSGRGEEMTRLNTASETLLKVVTLNMERRLCHAALAPQSILAKS
jgi:hypothetical protein